MQHEKPGGREPDGDVGEEDGAPADGRDEDPSDDRAAGETDSGHGAPDGKRTATRLRLGEGVGDQGERAGHQPGGTDALRDSSRDEERDGACDGTRRAGQDEHGQPDEEASAYADPVGQRAGEQEQRRERDGVSVDDPLRGRGRAAEVGADRAQRDVHDRRVERDHQEPRGDCSQREP